MQVFAVEVGQAMDVTGPLVFDVDAVVDEDSGV